jgi:hypothetical protein
MRFVPASSIAVTVTQASRNRRCDLSAANPKLHIVLARTDVVCLSLMHKQIAVLNFPSKTLL